MEQIILSQMCHFRMTKVVCTTILPPPIVYEAVDLGLPSGTKWASQNVGARKPSDAGLYFQWGDVSGYTADQVGTGKGKKKFSSDYSDYKWYLSGDSYHNVAFTKYTTQGATLELEDDAAHVNMGGSWHIPTPTQIDELIYNTTTAYTTSDGVQGLAFTSKKDNSKSIFIPAAGYVDNGPIDSIGIYISIWLSMLDTNDVYNGKAFQFAFGYIITPSIERYYGMSIRGVIG